MNYYLSGWNAVANTDYDGDGITATNEMSTSSIGSPGWPYGAANAGCDINTCATNGTQSCGSNVKCTSTLNSIAGPLYYYTFAFSCAPHTAGTVSGPGAWGCSEINYCAGNPCGAGYNCSVDSLSSWVSPGYTCAVYNPCTAGTDDCGANSTCSSTGTPGSPTSSYTCTCNYGYTGNPYGNACTVINECAGNPCNSGGDTGATCTNNAPGVESHTCTCTTGFSSNGNTCVSNCPAGQTTDGAPCGNGRCTPGSAGAWSCSCDAGYVSSPTGSNNPTCVHPNPCATGTAGPTDCQTSYSGNTCGDPGPPSLTHSCTCGNAAFMSGLASDGSAGCNPINYCSTNHCLDGGDTGATCANKGTGTVGYDCTCTNSFWMLGTVSGNPSCVDVNECLTGTPCGANGTCQNIGDGGGYACNCNPGYVSTPGKTPTCVLPDACGSGGGNAACDTADVGNTCSNNKPPSTSYTCTCKNAGYVVSVDGLHCVPINIAEPCLSQPCNANGDNNATCVAATGMTGGYTCQCDSGFAFDGVSCTGGGDPCLVGGVGPCGEGGICNSLPTGGYTCSCPQGAVSSGGATPTCVSAFSKGVQVTVIPGSGCSVAATSTPSTAPLVLLLAALAFMLRRRARSQ